MPASTLERTARPRRSRTRSRNINGRPALAVSTLKPHQYDLRPACASLVCPDCKTWVPITGIQAKKPKLVPHDTGLAGKDVAVRCQGSNRLVAVDVKAKKWEERLVDGHAETAHRRRTTVLRKPKVAVAPAVSQIAAQKQTATTGDESSDGRPLWLLREMKWASTESAVRDADTRRAELPAGDAPLGAPPVPLKTLHPKRRAS
ncbi:hypothetical protein [Streptomyces capillispiralis]|uniref:Uncharacterized protein n=1 Tax=Streptomyces capillispiralis TaxID=68182 RepID=A0A561SGH2_9ACTN|nr:hypothetical protein [Streptomyces capillispiralis]TWF73907.1 hypothetical protein FHX78_1326 [Streptomyces capillispiralis]GHE24420.1 hypothetical protein GCM10017779_72280 [Streptomyces capillispiralis]